MMNKVTLSGLPAQIRLISVLRLGIMAAFVLVGSCNPISGPPTIDGSASDEAAARQTLVRFFHDLKDGDYEAAADLYGGSYETMVEHNPTITPNDRGDLLRAACTINGAQCLDIRSAILDSAEKGSDGAFIFSVAFNRADGTLFTLGPCCGEEPGGTAPQTEFRFEVRKTSAHSFKVMTPLVYAP